MFILLIAFCHIIYYESRKESCRYGLFVQNDGKPLLWYCYVYINFAKQT